MDKKKNLITQVGICLFAAFVILAICSKSSFLYKINNWGDASCYFNEGRGILNGLVPFRDMAEQKGPVIFFVYALGELLFPGSFTGIFIIEIICSALFLYFAVKTVGLFADTKKVQFIIPFVFAAAVYGAYVFRHGGGPEEMSLCIFAYLLYLGTRYLEKELIPGKGQMISLGIGAGLIFWTKYTLCAMFIAVLVIMLICAVKRAQVKEFFGGILFFILGCILISIPVIGYFGANGALKDLFINYFYNNIFLYRANEGLYKGFGSNMKLAVSLLLKSRNVLALLLLAVGMVWMLFTKRIALLISTLISFGFTFVVINSGICQKYGNLPLFVFCVFGFCPLASFLNSRKIKVHAIMNLFVVVACAAAAYVLCIHTVDMKRSREYFPQYVFADEMNNSGIENYSYLYYGTLDEGYYYGADYLPRWRAYVQLNQGGSELKDLQDGYVNNREPDFIVSERMLCDSSDKERVEESLPEAQKKLVVTFDDFGYEMIDEMSYYYEEYDHVVRLYKKKITGGE